MLKMELRQNLPYILAVAIVILLVVLMVTGYWPAFIGILVNLAIVNWAIYLLYAIASAVASYLVTKLLQQPEVKNAIKRLFKRT